MEEEFVGIQEGTPFGDLDLHLKVKSYGHLKVKLVFCLFLEA